jgi:hypothetical protein
VQRGERIRTSHTSVPLHTGHISSNTNIKIISRNIIACLLQLLKSIYSNINFNLLSNFNLYIYFYKLFDQCKTAVMSTFSFKLVKSKGKSLSHFYLQVEAIFKHFSCTLIFKVFDLTSQVTLIQSLQSNVLGVKFRDRHINKVHKVATSLSFQCNFRVKPVSKSVLLLTSSKAKDAAGLHACNRLHTIIMYSITITD